MNADPGILYRAVITKDAGDVLYTVALRRVAPGSDTLVTRGATYTRRGARRWAHKMFAAYMSGRGEVFREEVALPDFDRELRGNPGDMRAAIAELRRDERAATDERIRAAQEAAFDDGFTACANEHTTQRFDPRYPITRRNPYKARA